MPLSAAARFRAPRQPLQLRKERPTMDCHSCERKVCETILAFILLATFAEGVHAADTGSVPPPRDTAVVAPVADRHAPAAASTRAMRHDAALNDIRFTNPKSGWAVGDRGVIWHTEDGGATWQEQQSNTACNLGGLCMLDENRGWAVGGESQQGRAATRGTVLRTEDGGNTWTQLSQK